MAKIVVCIVIVLLCTFVRGQQSQISFSSNVLGGRLSQQGHQKQGQPVGMQFEQDFRSSVGARGYSQQGFQNQGEYGSVNIQGVQGNVQGVQGISGPDAQFPLQGQQYQQQAQQAQLPQQIQNGCQSTVIPGRQTQQGVQSSKNLNVRKTTRQNQIGNNSDQVQNVYNPQSNNYGSSPYYGMYPGQYSPRFPSGYPMDYYPAFTRSQTRDLTSPSSRQNQIGNGSTQLQTVYNPSQKNIAYNPSYHTGYAPYVGYPPYGGYPVPFMSARGPMIKRYNLDDEQS